MGGALGKEVPDPRTGMTERERRAIQQTWSLFTKSNHEYGVVMFLALFQRYPEYLNIFPLFRGKSLKELPEDARFRAHGCAIGYQLSSFVDSIGDPPLLEALIHKNAAAHLERAGVSPFHFQSLGKVVIDILKAEEEKLMTPPVVLAWEKLFSMVVSITIKVFEECPPTSEPSRKSSRKSENTLSSSASPSSGTLDTPQGERRHHKKHASSRASGASSPASPRKH